jgi:trans-aconitate 2-methyltransferase
MGLSVVRQPANREARNLSMTEWDAAKYAQRSQLQQAMADEVLALLDLKGTERVLDIGCGDGRVTAEIAARLPGGSVVGVDSSRDMIAFACDHLNPAVRPNLRFEVADARRLPFRNQFDFVVSFNALHWLPDQGAALRGIRAAMKAGACAQLRLVPKGERRSLEDVLEETRQSPRWSDYFGDFRDPYLHLTPEDYAALAKDNGFQVRHLHAAAKSWDFKSRQAFGAFGRVTMVEWTRRLPESEKPAFVADVLERYRSVAAANRGERNTFKFYQMDITLAPA